MIQRLGCLDKPVLSSNAKDIAQMMNEAARRSNAYALKLMGAGIRSDVTPQDVIRLGQIDQKVEMLNSQGNFTEAGKNLVSNAISWLFNTKSKEQIEKVTIGQYLNNMLLKVFMMQENNLRFQKMYVMSEISKLNK